MGLAPYGKPIYSKLIKEKLIKINNGFISTEYEIF